MSNCIFILKCSNTTTRKIFNLTTIFLKNKNIYFIQGVTKLRAEKKIQYLHRSFIKWPHFFLDDRGYFKVFFHNSLNHHFWLKDRNVPIFEFSKNAFEGEFPRWLKAFEPIRWLEAFEAIFFSLLEDHWIITTSKRFMLLCNFSWDMEFLVDYLLDDANFRRKLYFRILTWNFGQSEVSLRLPSEQNFRIFEYSLSEIWIFQILHNNGYISILKSKVMVQRSIS